MCLHIGLMTLPADSEASSLGVQVRLQLNDRQVDALKALHVRLTDQLLNVTSERLHISNLLQVRQQHTAYAHCTKSLPTCSSVRCCFPASLIAWHMAEYSGVSAPLKAFAWLRKCTLLWYPLLEGSRLSSNRLSDG